MDPEWIKIVSGMSSVGIVAVVVVTLAVIQGLRMSIRRAVKDSLDPHTHTFTACIERLGQEVRSIRHAVSDHGGKITELLVQVAALTAKADGMSAVNALRSRLEQARSETAKSGGSNGDLVPVDAEPGIAR